jgi:hypothetical protein
MLLGERRSVTLLLAFRPWELEDFRELRRPRPEKAAPRLAAEALVTKGAAPPT